MKAYRGIRGIASLVLNFGTRWGVSGQFYASAVLTQEKGVFFIIYRTRKHGLSRLTDTFYAIKLPCSGQR